MDVGEFFHGVPQSVVIDHLDSGSTSCRPDEADAPLTVDANAMLALAVSLQGLQPVGRRDTQIVQGLRVVENPQLAPRRRLDVWWHATRNAALPDAFGLLAFEVEDHGANVTLDAI